MFTVIEDYKCPCALERSNQRIILGIALLKLDLDCRCDAIQNKRRIAKRRQVYKAHAIRKLLKQVRCNLDRKSCLSASARAEQCHDAMIVDQSANCFLFAFSSNERGQFDWREFSSKIWMRQLEQVFSLGQISQPMLTQVDERRVSGQRSAHDLSRNTRNKNLPTVRDAPDAGRPVHVRTTIITGRFASMNRHANANGHMTWPWFSLKRALNIERC